MDSYYLSMGGNNSKLYVFTDQMYQQLLTGASHYAEIYKLLTCYTLFELTEKLALEASLCVFFPSLVRLMYVHLKMSYGSCQEMGWRCFQLYYK